MLVQKEASWWGPETAKDTPKPSPYGQQAGRAASLQGAGGSPRPPKSRKREKQSGERDDETQIWSGVVVQKTMLSTADESKRASSSSSCWLVGEEVVLERPCAFCWVKSLATALSLSPQCPRLLHPVSPTRLPAFPHQPLHRQRTPAATKHHRGENILAARCSKGMSCECVWSAARGSMS